MSQIVSMPFTASPYRELGPWAWKESRPREARMIATDVASTQEYLLSAHLQECPSSPCGKGCGQKCPHFPGSWTSGCGSVLPRLRLWSLWPCRRQHPHKLSKQADIQTDLMHQACAKMYQAPASTLKKVQACGPRGSAAPKILVYI